MRLGLFYFWSPSLSAMNKDNIFDLPFMDNVAFPILIGVFAFFALLEFFIVLRPWKAKRLPRWVHNALLSITGLPLARFLLLPVTVYSAYYFGQHNIGILNWVQLPVWLEWTLGLLVLDYAIYIWHRLNHRVPFLWRFHNVHHADTEMDISTAIRFHFGELLMSIPFRLIVIAISGVSPMMLLLFEVIFESATLFHHSNIKLPKWLEGGLVRFIVTPRMHGIHHSIVKDETDSNYSTVLNWWDRLHGTKRLDVKQENIIIGVPAYRENADNKFWMLLIHPFKKQREWKLRNGTIPERREEEKEEVFR